MVQAGIDPDVAHEALRDLLRDAATRVGELWAPGEGAKLQRLRSVHLINDIAHERR
ncbi:hypothetical protein HEK616_40770 [Streptomyces nigrescens]|uniref:Uncharacterized protein n=1 Tax=Streptomyces nigrescens TaxID=1920 RepID=A0ABM7ZW46_STRNI|nr:hypothetical protein HEK616_40770 [Streptomyces nigrescens]